MAAKTQSESTTRGSAAGTGRRHRRREISGILLLAGGLFAVAGIVWLLSSNSAAIGILFIVIGLAFVGLSSGFVRRR